MEQFFKDPKTLQRLRSGPLEPYLSLFAKQLSSQGYSWGTGRAQIRVINNFGLWLEVNGIAIREITAEQIENYLQYRASKWRPGSSDARALNQMLNLLRQEGIVPQITLVAMEPRPVDWLLEQFFNYLRKERALALSSIESYVRIAGRFLLHRFGKMEIDHLALCAIDAIDFVKHEARRLSRKGAKNVTVAMRSFLQFLQFKGYTSLNLATAVPTVANWSMATIPKSLPTNLVKQVLSSCNRRTVIGQRDYAILLLLARLGLRAGEIVGLTLEDIDWSAGCITVTGKGKCSSKLPLPKDVGEALVAHLQNRIPGSNNRAVFLTSCPPVKGFNGPASVSAIVRRALTRAGIDSPRKGAHQFRHSLASEMLRQGATLAEIGELLRHRNQQSTTIYAKVDLVPLRSLAMEWPGGAR